MEKTPSFYVNPASNYSNCYGCPFVSGPYGTLSRLSVQPFEYIEREVLGRKMEHMDLLELDSVVSRELNLFDDKILRIFYDNFRFDRFHDCF